MNRSEFLERTRNLGISIIRVANAIQKTTVSIILIKQLIRCATSVGANYRAVCRAKSRADFIAKLKIVEEEADETIYWLDLLVNAGFLNKEIGMLHQKEANEILAMIVASIKTAKQS